MSETTKNLGVIGLDENGAPVNGTKEPIMVSLSSFKNAKYLDIRKYYFAENGEMLPTKKGVTLHKDQLSELIKILSDNKVEIDNWL